jgi:2-polyprenyl-3-methyl-5-hydroxy-6-metoxy-1,4-benzoquinol methylase/glycosyltransferase involved in cell wall biosynthesis
MSKVFDCFLYCDEADTLEIRLNELDPVVDRFVLCEATRSFSNQPKPLHFQQQRDRFARFLPRITHLVVDGFPPELSSPRELRHYQRNALARGLVDCSPDDIVIVSDVGEIPRAEVVRSFEGPLSGLRLRHFSRYLNLEDVALQGLATRNVIARYAYMGTPQQLRWLGRSANVSNAIVDNAGWRLSHLGDTDWIGCDQDGVWDFVPVDSTYPATVLQNRERFENLIAQSAPRTTPPGDSYASIYFGQERPEVVDIVPCDAHRVLELGCASGRLGEQLKRRQECHVTGIELAAEVGALAETRLDRVIVADCETVDFASLFEQGEFDCLIAADVLEHLRDPEAVLRRLQPFLRPDASIVVSLPNVRNGGVLEGALRGYWSYQKWGILDRTHLRFFTRREIDNMFARLGFEVEERRSVDEPALAEWQCLGRPRSLTFGALTINSLPEDELRELFVLQWLVRVRSAVRPRAMAGGAPDGNLEIDALDLDELVPRINVVEDVVPELTSQLHQARQQIEGLQAQEERLKEQLAQANSTNALLSASYQHLLDERKAAYQSLTAGYQQMLDERDAAYQSQTASYQQMLDERDAAYQSLSSNYEYMVGERDGAYHAISALHGSTSWRVTAPLRSATAALHTMDPTPRGGLRRARRVLQLAATGQLTGRVAARLRAPARLQAPVAVQPPAPPATVTYSVRPIAADLPLAAALTGEARRLICVTHVLPYPMRAGNEYRIHHLLSWLGTHGWDVLLLVYPLPEQVLTAAQLDEAVRKTATQYPNLVVCRADGTLQYRLRENWQTLLENLQGRHPRNFAGVLEERHAPQPPVEHLLELMREICPDPLIDVLLHLDSAFKPDVLLAEYVFMTRPFPLLRPDLVKVVDTHDVFSARASKVAEYGLDDRYIVPADLESHLLNRADVLIAIQPDDADALRELAPRTQVISVGVDFELASETAPPERAVVMVVGSGNPLNVKGLNDFLRLAWPLVRKSVPDAELHIVGAIGGGVDPHLPGVQVLGRVDDLDAAYAAARVVVNPTIAGTGLKIKTVEALCHLRPIVLWPSGVDGLAPEMRQLCQVATDWYDFAQRVIGLLTTAEAGQQLIERRSEIACYFAAEQVYAPLASGLENA